MYEKKGIPEAHVIQEIEDQGKLEEYIQLENARPSLRIYKMDIAEEYEEYQRKLKDHYKECIELFRGG